MLPVPHDLAIPTAPLLSSLINNHTDFVIVTVYTVVHTYSTIQYFV